MQYRHFQDFDAFAATVRNIDSTMMLQNPTYYSWSFIDIDLAEIHLQVGLEGSGNITEGQSRSDGYLIFLPLNHAGLHRANGIALSSNSWAILEPGSDFCVRCPVEHDWCSVFVPTSILARESNLILPPSGSEKMNCRVSRPNPQLAYQLSSLVRSIVNAATNCAQFESSPAATCATAELSQVASLIIGQGQGDKLNQRGRRIMPRQEIIRRSQELLEERDGEPVLVEELAAAAEVSERTLRTAFNEYFGVGPVRYLHLRQLHQVHRALRGADPKAVSVTDVLVEYGVWEFSRFASRYRQLFGELPSETLRRKKQLLLPLNIR